MIEIKDNLYAVVSSLSQIEGDAIKQLESTLALPGMLYGVAQPDIHPGKGGAIGVAFLSKKIIYPYLIGNDIGCGMSFFTTDIKCNKFKIDKISKKLSGIELPFNGDVDHWLNAYNLPSEKFQNTLGTIGGGNHFAEFQKITTIKNREIFNQHRLNKDKVFLLIHSGSRGFGESVLRNHIQNYKSLGIKKDDPNFSKYLQAHDECCLFARCNREVVAQRFFNSLNTQGKKLIDLTHNQIKQITYNGKKHFIHRKGVSSTKSPLIIIPGSRGDYSYLVKPRKHHFDYLYSIAHGAGRKWRRGETKARLAKRFKQQDLLKTSLGSWVICEDKDLIYEEAPQAYKNINKIIEVLEVEGLIEVVAILSPLLTYKKRKIR